MEDLRALPVDVVEPDCFDNVDMEEPIASLQKLSTSPGEKLNTMQGKQKIEEPLWGLIRPI